MKCNLFLFIIVALISYSCENKETSTHFSHGEGDVHGYLMPGLDHGLVQSPINILSKETESGRHDISLNFSGKIKMVENLGHTIQLDFEPGNTVTVDGEIYEAVQVHFHTPSEHLIDGMTFPMEMHVVNIQQGHKKGDTPSYLVIGYLFKMGDENAFINNFIDLIPDTEGSSKEVELSALLGDKSPEEVVKKWSDFYHYRGSLTTPPYTESVEWYVLTNIHEASPAQIRKINEYEGDNARHIQAVYGRPIDH
jgi:carbonic anhydrase